MNRQLIETELERLYQLLMKNWERTVFKKYKKENEMFNEEQKKLLKEKTEKELEDIQCQIKDYSRHIAYNGKKLSDLLELEEQLNSILNSLKEDGESVENIFRLRFPGCC